MTLAARQGKSASPPPDVRGRLQARELLQAFSLLEVLVATSILMVILFLIFSLTHQMSGALTRSTAKIEAFQAGRAGFDSMTRQISLATLNTYYDYFDVNGTARGEVFKASGATGLASFIPDHYGRYSDLHFVTGKSLVPSPMKQIGHAIFFQAPLGYSDDVQNYGAMDTLLNAGGYFIVYGKDETRPKFLDDGTVPSKPADRYRFRLMRFCQPSQNLAVYANGTMDWFTKPLKDPSPPLSIVAENVVALVILPKLSKADEAKGAALTRNFEYNTRPASPSAKQGATDYQLPPVLEVMMVAIDEPSALRLCKDGGAPDFGVPGGLASLFQEPDTTKPEDPLARDLKTLTDAFISQHVTYRVFRSEIALRGAKWTSTPTP